MSYRLGNTRAFRPDPWVLLFFICLLIGVLLGGWATSGPAHCAEDDPCWNCQTMGNELCGVQP